MLTAERLREVLNYDPWTGVFTWLIFMNSRAQAGDIARYIDSHGHRIIWVDGARYRAHRLAFLYMTSECPTAEIDHKNTIPDDNRWENLREATTAQNQWNQRVRNNTSGFKCVVWHKRARKWQAQIYNG